MEGLCPSARKGRKENAMKQYYDLAEMWMTSQDIAREMGYEEEEGEEDDAQGNG